MFSFPLFISIYAGFTHAFEADHLLAVSNIVSQRNNIRMSLKDGAFWGLGHASTILMVGLLVILFKTAISNQLFRYFEACVGIMLMVLALYRLVKFFGQPRALPHSQPPVGSQQGHPHVLAYSIGLVHGLAGSGALIVLVLSQIQGAGEGLLYLLVFGTGCIAGMCVAAGLFSIPFSKKIMKGQLLPQLLVLLSGGLCLFYGGFVVYQNLWA